MKTCADTVLALLQKVTRTPNGWEACCPAHEDRHASLSIGTGEDGRILLNCHAGCAPEAVVAALGLKMVDLFPGDGARPTYPARSGRAAGDTIDRTDRTPRPAKGGPSGRVAATYPYCDASGALLFEVVRFDPKDFRQRRPDGKGGWIWSLGDTPRALYRLPELLAADKDGWVFVCEGEKDVDAVRAVGLAATCNPGGAGKWGHLTDDSALHGRRVAIIPDNDPPEKKYAGQRHAQDVAARLYGKAADVRILNLRKGQGFMGKDVSDWLDANDSKEPADLARALTDMADAAPPWTPDDASQDDMPPAGPSPVIVSMANVKPEPVKWLWPSRIALGKLTVIAGDPGLGKSFVTLDMAARVSVGGGWPDAPLVRTTPGGVVLLSAEDDPADTIRPRLDAVCADVRRILLLEAIQDSDRKQRSFNLAQDLEALEDAIATASACRLVIVDPISAYLGETDSHKNAEVRAVLAPLGALAARRGVAVVAVTHLRKGEGAAIYRAMGSLAFVAAARAVYAVTRDPQDQSGDRRFLLPVKNNLGRDRDGLAYRLQSDGGNMPRVAWESEPVKAVADEILSARVRKPGPAPEGRDAAAEWLRVELANGARPSQELFEEARREGISKRTLQRAKQTLGVLARKTRFDGRWIWELPEGRQPMPDPDNLASLGELGALRRNPNRNAGSEASETPTENQERQDRQVPDSGADTLSNGL